MVMLLADVIFICCLLSNCNRNHDTQLIGSLLPEKTGLKAESSDHICSEIQYVININLTEVFYFRHLAI